MPTQPMPAQRKPYTPGQARRMAVELDYQIGLHWRILRHLRRRRRASLPAGTPAFNAYMNTEREERHTLRALFDVRRAR